MFLTGTFSCENKCEWLSLLLAKTGSLGQLLPNNLQVYK